MMGLLDEYPMPVAGGVDPQELERLKYLTMMRMGLGVAGREPLGSAMQGGINTYVAGEESARRNADQRMQDLKARMAYAQAEEKRQRTKAFINSMTPEQRARLGIDPTVWAAIMAEDDPGKAYLQREETKPYTLGNERFNAGGSRQQQTLSPEGYLIARDPAGNIIGRDMAPGAVESTAATEQARALGKGLGEAATTFEEVPVAGGKAGQTERVTRLKLLQEEANRGQPPQTMPGQVPGQYPLRVAPEVQAQRDQVRMSILQNELADAVAKGNKSDIAAISKEIDIINNKQVTGATLVATNRRVKDPVAQKEAEARIPSTPEGYRWTDKGLEQVPGGPKDTSEQEKLKITNAVNRADLVMKKVDEVKKAVDWTTVGPASSLVGWVPGTPQYDLKKNVDMLKANIGFQELAAMRAASPTGGALGQVALQELDMLQSTLGSLDTSQSPTEIKKNLDNVMTHFNNWKRTMEQSGAKFNRGGSGDWGGPTKPSAPDPLGIRG